MPDLQKLGDCCRRLLGSLDVDVQVSVCTSRCCLVESSECARMVKCLAPHLNGMSQDVNWSPEPEGFMLSDLLPAAAQLEHVTSTEDLSLLGHFRMLKELHVVVQNSFHLTAPLPQLHTLALSFFGSSLGESNLQCLFTQAPCLRQLALDRYEKSRK